MPVAMRELGQDVLVVSSQFTNWSSPEPHPRLSLRSQARADAHNSFNEKREAIDPTLWHTAQPEKSHRASSGADTYYYALVSRL